MSSIRHADRGIGHGPDRADSGMMLRPRFCDRASVRPGIGRLRGRARTKAAAAAMALVMGLAACGTGGAASMGDPNKADLVFWGWDAGNGMKGLIADFRRDNPDITVKFSNTGTASDTQIALSNAIAAGNGAPDIIMLEAPNITQFAMTGGLVDLSSMGAASYADDFAAGPWNKVQVDGKPYALPIDSGPAMLFYNKAIFDKAGVDGTAIETWDDYYEAARKIRAVGSYITNQSGTEYQSFTAAAWQAGVMPWRIDGENITIDMTENPGMRRYIDFQQKLIDEDLIDTRTAPWWNAHGEVVAPVRWR